MAGFLLTILILGVLVVGGLAAAAVLGGKAVGKNAEKKNQVVAGIPSNAPANWYGSHEPEAKLHRRVRDAVTGLQETPTDDPNMFEVRASVEREAVSLDNQIVAASKLADRLKPDVLESLSAAVDQFEDITARLITRTSGLDDDNVRGELDELTERLDLLREARQEVDEAQQEGGTQYFD